MTGLIGANANRRLAFVSPVVDYARSRLNQYDIAFVGLADGSLDQGEDCPPILAVIRDFCASNPEVRQYRTDCPDGSDGLDDIVAELEQLAPDAVLYAYEYDIATADKLAIRLAPRFANDPATASWREDKHAIDRCLRSAGLPAPAGVLFTLQGGLGQAELDQLDPAVHNVVIKTPHFTSSPVWAAKEDVWLALATMRDDGRDLNEVLLCQDAYFDYDADGLQQSYSIDGFALEGQCYFVSVQRWHKIITATGIDYCWAEQLDVRASTYADLLVHAGTVFSQLGLRNGFFHSDFTYSENGFILFDLNPRLAGGSGVIDRFIAAQQGAGVVDEFVRVMYGDRIGSAPQSPPASRLLSLYGLSLQDQQRVAALESVAEVVPFGASHFVRFEHHDEQRMLTDVRYCLDAFTLPRYGVSVSQATSPATADSLP
ncbi:MAG: hypothetical protein K2Q25_01315 [Mycobacteriaceae bacterium]|nr:hypothetical protein [Mycobacteriaceae bacterium]